MSDQDILGLANALFPRCRDEWGEFLDDLDVRIVTFEDLELQSDSSDSEIWHACQQNNVVLLTANRNKESDESLEATIRERNQSPRADHRQRRRASYRCGLFQSDDRALDGNAR